MPQERCWRHSYNTLDSEIMLQTYCKEGNLDRTIDALCRMNLAPSKHAYIEILKLCGKRKSLKHVKLVHSHLSQQGMELDDLLGDHLVVALSNCFAIQDALDLLYKLPHYTVHSWTAIISASLDCISPQYALSMHQMMQGHNVQPNSYTFVILFKACSSVPHLERGKELHSDACRRGFTSIIFVNNSILSMYGKCGAVQEAENVFQGMLHRDVVSWNSMLSMYIQYNKGELGLLLYRQMQEEGLITDQHTMVYALQACASLISGDGPSHSEAATAEIGQALHADASRLRLSSDVFVGTALCSMYARVGLVVHGENVFINMSNRDIVSWNAMLSVYIDLGENEKALQLFAHMHSDELNPNELTFAAALKACSSVAEKQEDLKVCGSSSVSIPLEIGHILHADAQLRDLTSSTFFGTSLLNMYGKCGAVLEAEHLFHTMSERDIVSWNVLMSTYVQQGQGEKALLLYRQMLEEGVNCDQHTIVSALQACGILAEKEETVLVEGQTVKMMALQIGQSLHSEAYGMHLASDVYVSNTLVSMYGKCGMVNDAEMAFSALSNHDSISWNSMLTTYIQLGIVRKALQSYKRMLIEQISPDKLTFVILLQACGILAEKDNAFGSASHSLRRIACEIAGAFCEDIHINSFVSDVQIVNTLISVYGKCGAIHEAELVFMDLQAHDGVVSWTAMLSAYVEQSQGAKALQLYSKMQGEGICPNHLTYMIALQACGILAEREDDHTGNVKSLKECALKIGKSLHSESILTGYDSEMLVGTLLVTMYGKCGAIAEAENVFFCLSHKDVNLWNAMISIHVAQGQEEDAIHLYCRLKIEKIILDDVTYLSVLQACSETGSLEICSDIHFQLASAGYDQISSMAATIVHTYGSCASMTEVDALFDWLPNPDVVSLTACICCHAGEGSLIASEHVLEIVRLAGMEPDGVLFTSLLSACSHIGLVVEGLEYFTSMKEDYCIMPLSRHMTTMVDLFGRAGNFLKVLDILGTMTTQDETSCWLSLLGACRLHSNTELAKEAFFHAVKLHPEQAAAYILMANVYTEADFNASMAVVES
ncbi:hypothetical protein KP509_29G083700 [Ceratopteris richardii]|nr:hypothetical protein KP509_29G083700 [Ceratopteris richardii]